MGGNSDGFRNFKTGGTVFLGLGFVLMPLHNTLSVCSREVNKIHIVNIVCWLKSTHMHVIQSKFNPKHFSNRGARARRAGPGPAFEYLYNIQSDMYSISLKTKIKKYIFNFYLLNFGDLWSFFPSRIHNLVCAKFWDNFLFLGPIKADISLCSDSEDDFIF